MGKLVKSFIVVLLLISGKTAFSQYTIPADSSSIYVITSPININLRPLSPILAPDYYSSRLGFFCTREAWLEKKTKIPLRLRLGSLPYTNYLEQKPGYRQLPAF